MPREAEFAARYGVSRQAVREALKVLAAKGLISSRRRAGTKVLPRSQWNLLDPDVLAWHPPGAIAPEFLGDLIELRRLIEPAAAAFAAKRAGPQRLARIKAALEGMRANTNDVGGFYDFDTEFHAALFAASGNSLIDRLSDVIGAVLRTSFDIQSKTRPSYALAVEQHDTLFSAIAAGDAERARRAMEEILSVASGEVEQVAQQAREAEGHDPTSPLDRDPCFTCIHDARTPADALTEERLYPSSALHGRVAHDIGRSIARGRIAEGDLLAHEARLSESYEVSRQAIREALKVLAAKGLVVSRRRAGTRVAPRSHWNLLDPDVLAWHDPADLSRLFAADLVELRELIEPAAAAFAARRATPDRIAAIGAALEALRRGIGDLQVWSIADVAFHKAIFAASGNTLIERLSTILEPLLKPSFELQLEVGGGVELAHEQHRIVYEAIVARDLDLARRTMESILIVARNQVTRGTQPEREGEAASPRD